MEVFNVFATLSLVDLLSSPLERVGKTMSGVTGVADTLSARFGRLTVAMAPVALAAGVMLGAFGLATARAMEFESAMADVAKVVNFDTPQEFAEMSDQVKELSGRIPMAADGIAAIIAAAGQSGVAKQDLTEFAEQAAKMGVAFDLTGDQAGKMMADWRAGMNLSLPQTYALADATNYLSNNMNATAPALGEVIQRVGAAAMSCGLAETQVAALGASFLSAGASPEVAATALKKFTTTLVKGAAMSKTQAAAFSGLGFSVTQMAKDMQTDAQGTIFKVLQSIADKPKELQMSLLTEMFGEEAIGAIAPLLQNMGNLSQAFDLVGDSSKYAGSMQAEFEARSKTTQNALQLLSNKLNNLFISIGSVFLPAVAWGAEQLGKLADAVRWVVDTPFGQWLVGISGGIAAALVGVTTLSAALWFFSAAGPMLGKALAPLKVALFGLGWPVWALIAAVGLLYLAYKKNFGGIADTLNRCGKNISLVVRGVIAIFQSLTGSTFEIRGELAKEIRAAGLEALVVNVGRMVFRIKEFFAGIWDGLDFSGAVSALTPAIPMICDWFNFLGQVMDDIFGTKIQGASSEARGFGQIVGTVLSVALEGLATVITSVALGIDTLIQCFRWVAAVLNGDWATATAAAQRIWDNMCASFMSFADLFRIGDWIRDAWAKAQEYLSGINLFESGARLLETFKEGIMSKVDAVVESVSGALDKVRQYLPFSDAKTGPLSTLTLSGTRMMTTIGDGVKAGAPSLQAGVVSALGGVGDKIFDFWKQLTGQQPELTPQVASVQPDPIRQDVVENRIPAQPVAQPMTPDVTALPAGLSGVLDGAGELIASFWQRLTGQQPELAPQVAAVQPDPAQSGLSLAVPNQERAAAAVAPRAPEPPAWSPESSDRESPQFTRDKGRSGTTMTVHIGNISLPNVKNAQEFFDELQNSMMEYGESIA